MQASDILGTKCDNLKLEKLPELEILEQSILGDQMGKFALLECDN